MKRHPLAVIGLGNLLFQDEGAGLYAVSLLKEQYPGLPVDYIAAGTPGYNLLHQFEGRKRIIFIDAGYCEVQPGEFRRFTHSDVISKKQLKNYSLHEFDLITLLTSAEQMGFLEGVDVSIYCIQVEKTGFSHSSHVPVCGTSSVALGDGLTNKVKDGLSELTRAVYNECIESICSKGVGCKAV